jgi:hypothetical protein
MARITGEWVPSGQEQSAIEGMREAGLPHPAPPHPGYFFTVGYSIPSCSR